MADQAHPGRRVTAERRDTFYTVETFRALDDERRAWLLREAVELAAGDAGRQAEEQGRTVSPDRLRVELTVRLVEE